MIRLMILILRILFRLLPVLILYIALYRDSAHNRLKKAGFQEKDHISGDVRFHYAVSPGSEKPPLLLLHGHMHEWFTWNRVLSGLAEKYHVYAVDMPGHGKTRYPDDYIMSAASIGSSLASFIEEVIGEPVYICGHSAGGLVTLWLAADRPDLIRAAVLEDPALLTGEYPAVRNTAAYETYAVCARAVEQDTEGDFPLFFLKNSRAFLKDHPFPGFRFLITVLVTLGRMLHGNSTLEIPFVSPSFRELFRGMDLYDPHFGKAFFEGTWNEGFDHAGALARITCPILLMQAEASSADDGTLLSAMSDEAAAFAAGRLQKGTLKKIPSSALHLDDPQNFLESVTDFFQ